MTTFLSIGNQVTLTTKFLDANDNPLFGFGDTITWNNDNTGAVTLQIANDAVSAIVIALSPGTANVSATLGTLSLTNQFVVNSPASGFFIIGPPVGANSVIGRV